MATANKVRVAILGGGLAGVAVLHGLLKAPNVDVHIFESAKAFREQGQGIGFNTNALDALELLGLADRLAAAKAVKMNDNICNIAEGPDSGKIAFEMGSTGKGTWIVQRAHFLTELLKGIDEERMHAGKKLSKLEQGSDGVKLWFEDGSTHGCDILLGADGIYSTVRKYVVGHDHPSANAEFAGWWTIWTLVPFDKAQKFLGKDLMDPENPRQQAWCGHNTWIMHDQLSNNTMTQCVIARRVTEEGNTEWSKKTNRDELYKDVANFGVDLGRNMVDLVTDGHDELDMVPLWHHKPQAPNYVNNNVAIVGDAADATTPWKGSGGGMSLEDAWILSQLFQKVKTIDDAKVALKGYEKVNMPRRQRLGAASYDTGLTLCGLAPEVGLDAKKMSDKMAPSWDWIFNVDLEKQAADAIQAMEAAKA